MKKILLIFLIIILSACTNRTPPSIIQVPVAAPTPTLSAAVRKLDPTKFSGLWYELAAIPNASQRYCACTTNNYTWHHTHFNVASTCWIGHATGHLHSETQIAYPTLLTHRLHYRIFLPSGQHQHVWFFYVDELYRYAVIGTPDHRHLWIYAKNPDISDQEYQSLVALASSHGFNVKQLSMTDQSC